MPDYLEVIYDYDSHPKTSYPHQLTKYLFDKYVSRQDKNSLNPDVVAVIFYQAFNRTGLLWIRSFCKSWYCFEKFGSDAV